MALTPTGAAFLEDVREILDLVQAAEARVKRRRLEARGSLRLGFAPLLAGELVAALLKALKERGVKTKLELRDLSNREILSGIRERTLDAALLPASAVPRNRLYVMTKLSSHGLEVAIPKDHPLAKRKVIHVRDIAYENLVGYQKNEYSDYWNLLQEVFVEVGLTLVIGGEFDSGNSLIAAVQGGEGVAIIPANINKASFPDLVFRPLSGAKHTVEIGLLHHRDMPRELATALRTTYLEIVHSGKPR